MNQDSYKKQRHDVVRERQNKKELEVFVGGLDRYTNEVDLRDVFSQVGGTLFVGNICKTWSKDMLKEVKWVTLCLLVTLQDMVKRYVEGSQVGDTLFVGNIARHGQKIWYLKEVKWVTLCLLVTLQDMVKRYVEGSQVGDTLFVGNICKIDLFALCFRYVHVYINGSNCTEYVNEFVDDFETNLIAQMERCRKPAIRPISGFAFTITRKNAAKVTIEKVDMNIRGSLRKTLLKSAPSLQDMTLLKQFPISPVKLLGKHDKVLAIDRRAVM
ncbi:hypothetical protein Lser_V15G25202 [Lactuca serriola]